MTDILELENHLKDNLEFPFLAEVCEYQENDILNETYFRNYEGEIAIPKDDFEKAKTDYYRLRGWDEAKGWPTSQKLNQLGLSDVADILQKEKLGSIRDSQRE